MVALAIVTSKLSNKYLRSCTHLLSTKSRQGHYKEAEAETRAALALFTSYGPAHNHLGKILAAQGKASEAEQELKATIKCDLDTDANW